MAQFSPTFSRDHLSATSYPAIIPLFSYAITRDGLPIPGSIIRDPESYNLPRDTASASPITFNLPPSFHRTPALPPPTPEPETEPTTAPNPSLLATTRAKMAFKFSRSTSASSSSTTFIINAVLRFLQFVFAIAVIGLYGTDIGNARKGHEHQDSRWIYAEVVAALSALTCLVFMVPGLKSYVAFGWDLILFILWTAVFGVFASIYVHMNPNGDHNISRLKNAVWIDLINMLLWFVTAIVGAVLFWRNPTSRSTFTGRATV